MACADFLVVFTDREIILAYFSMVSLSFLVKFDLKYRVTAVRNFANTGLYVAAAGKYAVSGNFLPEVANFIVVVGNLFNVSGKFGHELANCCILFAKFHAASGNCNVAGGVCGIFFDKFNLKNGSYCFTDGRFD